MYLKTKPTEKELKIYNELSTGDRICSSCDNEILSYRSRWINTKTKEINCPSCFKIYSKFPNENWDTLDEERWIYYTDG